MTISLVKWILLAVLVSDISCACFKPKTVLISSGGRRMDYEGELMSEPINYKQVWYWSVATADGWDTLTSRKNYYSAQILKFKENACVNGSAVAVDNKVGLQPYSLWLPREGGYLISKCGPGFRLRKVGDWVKVIEDDPGKFTDDDKFDFQSTVVISSGGRRMDYEGELMSEAINYKQVWYWSVATANGWDTLTSRKNYHSAQILKFKENACVNGSAVTVDNKVGLQPYSLWLPREGGYLISKCGPGFRLRKVGDWVKVIEDDPGKFSDDDKFDFQSVNM